VSGAAGTRPRVVATDLDGTLLRSDGTLDQRTRAALDAVRAAGAALVLCTARPTRWMAELARATGHDGLALCANGAVLWDLGSERVLEHFPLTGDVARRVVDALRAALPDGAWAVETADGFGHEPAYTPLWPAPPGTVIDAIDVLIGEPVVKLMLRHPTLTSDELLDRARGLLAWPGALGAPVELTHSSSTDTLLEISAAGVSKASGLARVCERLGVVGSEVLAFGDMPNDLPMLRWAGHGVAVANAHPDVLAAADEVTAANDEAGVARVLERVFGTR
jgi:hypothetical protein